MEAHLQLYELMLSHAKPMALKAAVKLDIPDILAMHSNGNPMTVDQIASYISPTTNKDYLFRILRVLASIGVFSEKEEIVAASRSGKQYKYGLTKVSKLLMKKDNPQSYAPMLSVLTDEAVLDAYQLLHESVKEGCNAFNKAHGMSLFDYASNNSEFNTMFNQGMAAKTNALVPCLAKMYDAGFKSINTLVDVAGGTGSTLSIIVHHHPHIHGINFDLPHVIASASAISGVEHVAGDMFQRIPSADAVLIKCVLHDWDDERCVKVLKKCYEATAKEGKVLVVEAVVEKEEGGLRRTGLFYDMLMMAYTPGGKERTEEEFKELFAKAGFKSYRVIKLPFLQALIEVSK